MNGFSLVLAWLIDLVIGDPAWWPHPVRLIGWLISRLAGYIRKRVTGPRGLRLCGLLVVVVVVGLTWGAASLLLSAAGAVSPHWELGMAVFLSYTTLATRCLYDETWRVVPALRRNDLVESRRLVGMVVGRDTAGLDRRGILRALLETVAENLSDGVVAPLLYLAIGGPALGLAYKAVNTLDSMIGYKNDDYRHLGWAAARLDDVVNYIPARITAALIVLAALILRLDAGGALRIWFRDGGRHTSPNAGRPEAALAGALGIELGGAAVYGGQMVNKPTLGDAVRPLTEAHLWRAEQILYVTSTLMLAAVLAPGRLW